MADEADRTDLPMEESIDEGSCSANEALGADDATTEDTLLEDEGPQRSKEPQVVVKFTYSEHADTAARTDVSGSRLFVFLCAVCLCWLCRNASSGMSCCYMASISV